MKNPVKIIYKASKEVLIKRRYLLMFFLVAVVFFAVLFFLPVFAIPGNDINFQSTVFKLTDYLTMGFLSLIIALLISMQVYNFQMKRSAKTAGEGVLGSFSGFVAGIFGTASCASCVAAVFGFLGVGAVFFLIENQLLVVSVSGIVMMLSIYLTSKNILNKCDVCR